MAAYAVGDGSGVFEGSRALFEELVGVLAAPETGQMPHEELEVLVEGRGRELMRQLFQSHADLRAIREEPRTPTGSDGVVRSRVEKDRSRGVTTIFGPVRVSRRAYRSPGAGDLMPADTVWNLPVGAASHGLRRLAAIESARGSFESAQAAIERATGVRMGKRQIEDAVVADAVDIAAFYAARRPAPVDPEQVPVITCDGKGVVMRPEALRPEALRPEALRPEALRPATAKAAAASGGKLATRLSPGEKSNRKRMAELAGVYDVVPATRTVADIIADPADPDRERAPGPKATGKWLTGSVVDDTARVIASAFDEATRRDPDRERTWVTLVDGNAHQIEVITAEAARRGVDVHILIDFVHVTEYLWGAAWSFFDKGDPDAEAWVADKLCKILAGQARQVAAGIRRRATAFKFRGRERRGADKCADYLADKAEHLAYDTALASGWPIATGIIEGAARFLVKDRLDITGARWGLAGAEAVLLMRATISNGDFDNYWAYHLRQEQQRNHHSRYQQSYSKLHEAA